MATCAVCECVCVCVSVHRWSREQNRGKQRGPSNVDSQRDQTRSNHRTQMPIQERLDFSFFLKKILFHSIC